MDKENEISSNDSVDIKSDNIKIDTFSNSSEVVAVNQKGTDQVENLTSNEQDYNQSDGAPVNEQEFNRDEEDSELDDIVIDAKPDFFTKLSLICLKRKQYLIMTGIVSVLYFLLLLINGIFSGKNTILIGDSLALIGVYFNHIFNILSGKSSLFYSNYYGKGIEIFSTIQGTYSYPLYFLLVLFGRNNIDIGITVIAYFFLLFSALFTLWFINKYFKNISTFYKFLFTLIYVFSAYINYNCSYISWLIYPGFILLIIDRFLNFIKTEKIISFIVCFSIFIISGFSIGISTAAVLFILFMLYIHLCTEKSLRKKYMSKLFMVYVLTAVICFAVLFPTLIATLSISRSGSLWQNLIAKGNNYYITKLALVSSDFCLILFTIYYFIKCDKKYKLNWFLFISVLIAFTPMIFDSVMKILCFSSYQGFAGRLYFINEVSILIPSLLIFDKKLYKINEYQENKLIRFIIEFFITCLVLVFFLIMLFNYNTIGIVIKTPMKTESAILKFNFIFIILFLILICFAMFFYWRKMLTKSLIKMVVGFILIASLSINYLTLASCFKSNKINQSEINNAITSNNLSGNICYLDDLLSQYYFNDLDNVRQTSAFTSFISSKVIKSYSSLGYYVSNVAYGDYCGNLISDSINGIKYYYTTQKLNRPYLKKIETNTDKFYIYENMIATSGAFCLGTDFSFDGYSDIYERFDALKNYFEIEGELFSNVCDEDIILKQYFDKDDKLLDGDYDDISEEINKIGITFKMSSDGILYVNSYINGFGKDKSDELINYLKLNTAYICDIGWVNKNEEKTIYFNNIDNFEQVKFKFLNYSVAKKLCEELCKTEVKYTYEKNGYTVNVSADRECNLYVMTPNIDGYSYYLNGNKIEINETLGSMIYLKINAGDNVLSVDYKYPHLKTWIFILIISIAFVTAMSLLYKYKLIDKLEIVIYYAMCIVFVLLFAIIYVLGIFLSVRAFFI